MTTEDWKLQASYKHGVQQQHMLNVRGDNVHELKLTLDALVGEDALATIVSTGMVLSALDHTMPATDATPVQQQAPLDQLRQQQQPAQQAQPSAVSAPVCNHGMPRKFHSGVGAKGPWAAYFCQAVPKGDPNACDPQWVKA